MVKNLYRLIMRNLKEESSRFALNNTSHSIVYIKGAKNRNNSSNACQQCIDSFKFPINIAFNPGLFYPNFQFRLVIY